MVVLLAGIADTAEMAAGGEPLPPVGVEGLRFMDVAVKGIKLSGFGSGSRVMGLRPASPGVMTLVCAALAAGKSAG